MTPRTPVQLVYTWLTGQRWTRPLIEETPNAVRSVPLPPEERWRLMFERWVYMKCRNAIEHGLVATLCLSLIEDDGLLALEAIFRLGSHRAVDRFIEARVDLILATPSSELPQLPPELIAAQRELHRPVNSLGFPALDEPGAPFPRPPPPGPDLAACEDIALDMAIRTGHADPHEEPPIPPEARDPKTGK